MMRGLAFFALMAFTGLMGAQTRTIPKEALRGDLRHAQAMYVELNGKPVQLSPGAQIRDADNRLVLPTSLVEKADVRYLLDGAGLVHRVWIMTPLERAQAPQKPQQPATLPAVEK